MHTILRIFMMYSLMMVIVMYLLFNNINLVKIIRRQDNKSRIEVETRDTLIVSVKTGEGDNIHSTIQSNHGNMTDDFVKTQNTFSDEPTNSQQIVLGNNISLPAARSLASTGLVIEDAKVDQSLPLCPEIPRQLGKYLYLCHQLWLQT